MAARSKRSGFTGPPPRCPAAVLARRKYSQRIRLENRLAVSIRERQRRELLDVLLHVPPPRSGPIGAPQHPVRELGESRKVLQQLRGRNPGHVEPDVPVPTQDEERFLHVE